MSIRFTAHDHRYESTNGDNIEWLSVTSLIKLFKEPFDQQTVAEAASKKRAGKWYGMKPEDIIAVWNGETNRAVTLGSWYHGQREAEVMMCDTITRSGLALPIIRPIEEDGIKLAPEQSLSEGIYPEHLVYLKSAKICGQADRVEVISNTIDLYDYKTNKEIKLEGFTSRMGTKKMLGPCAHLDDCNFNHYALQLSTYMYMMIKHNPTLQPGKMQIHHIKFKIEGTDQYGYPVVATDPNGDPIVHEVVPYDVPYLKSEVMAMLNYLKIYPEIIKRGHA